MTQEHPITPPPELFAEWLAEAKRLHPNESLGFISGQIAQLAYRAGADMELEACCEWLNFYAADVDARDLRTARRPKPPSLKELNLKHLEVMERDGHYLPEIISDLRHAIESLPS